MQRTILNFKFNLIIICLLVVLSSSGQNFSEPFSKENFDKFWYIESESDYYSYCFIHDTLEIRSPKGLTLWFRQKLNSNIVIDYDACIMKEYENDRLSDLNCFWLATDPMYDDIWHRAKWRSGIFNRCYSLQCYYLGFGGNNNTTTRFRKYNGDFSSFEDHKRKPAVIIEFNDESHLLKANHWYHIHIESEGKKVIYMIDNQTIVEYEDSKPLRSGWFGFRTTHTRARMANFDIKIEHK
jgi:hypothetical protein